MTTLFPDTFLASIGRLSIAIKPAPPRAAVGLHMSPRNGASLEFRDYQPYAPGDDLRRVDWAVYGRTRHLFVRRFERPTAVPVYVLVDASGSMMLETPRRYATAARVAAAVASAGLGSQNPVHLLIAGGHQPGVPRAVTGRRGLVRVLAELAAEREPGNAGLAASMEALLPMLAAKGPGVLVVVSDFFEPAGVDALTAVLSRTPQRLVLIKVTQPYDAEPELSGDYELADCESDARLTVTADAAALARYHEAYRTYFAAFDAFAAARGVRQATVDASTETLGQLERLFPAGVMSL